MKLVENLFLLVSFGRNFNFLCYDNNTQIKKSIPYV